MAAAAPGAAQVTRPGVWVGVAVDRGTDAVNPAVVVSPCVVPFERYRVLSTRGVPWGTDAWSGCGKRMMFTAGYRNVSPVVSVFVLLDPAREPVKGPYTRFSEDRVTALLYTPALLLQWALCHGTSGCVEPVGDAPPPAASDRGRRPCPVPAAEDTSPARPCPQFLHEVLAGLLPDMTEIRVAELKERVAGVVATAGEARVVRHDRFPSLFMAAVAVLVVCLCDAAYAADLDVASIAAALRLEGARRTRLTAAFARVHGIRTTENAAGSRRALHAVLGAAARVRRLAAAATKKRAFNADAGASEPKPLPRTEWQAHLLGEGAPLADIVQRLFNYDEADEAVVAGAAGEEAELAVPLPPTAGEGKKEGEYKCTACYDDDLLRMIPPDRVAAVRDLYVVDPVLSDLRLLQPLLDRGYLGYPLVAWEAAAVPQGFHYFDAFLTDAEAAALAASVAPDLAPGQSFSTHTMLRRIAHYGFPYKYPDGGIDLESPFPEGMPAWVETLARRVESACGAKAGTLTQMTANEYLPGQGISSHFDEFTTIGEALATVSLGSDVPMQLVEPRTGRKVEVLLRKNSLAVFTGDARYAWTHGIAKRTKDKAAARPKADPSGSAPSSSERAHRVSLTFRNCPPTADWRG
eukprot:TRINITY_DN19728_c0_g1_i1.p1 TRINITY_DN19728_c0_g1~~TRINITY_DN19728_c0_g1_i1.p1  ORF type:complete len:635 (+),score=143.32 TRINITY_DN19728_c0_g1_i1:612-2516(+)